MTNTRKIAIIPLIAQIAVGIDCGDIAETVIRQPPLPSVIMITEASRLPESFRPCCHRFAMGVRSVDAGMSGQEV